MSSIRCVRAQLRSHLRIGRSTSAQVVLVIRFSLPLVSGASSFSTGVSSSIVLIFCKLLQRNGRKKEISRIEIKNWTNVSKVIPISLGTWQLARTRVPARLYFRRNDVTARMHCALRIFIK